MAYRIKSKTVTDHETNKHIVYEYIYDKYNRLEKILEDNRLISSFEHYQNNITCYSRYDEDGVLDFQSHLVMDEDKDGLYLVRSKDVCLNGVHFFGISMDAKEGYCKFAAISGELLYNEKSSEQIDIVKKIYTWNRKMIISNQRTNENLANINEYVCLMNDYMNYTVMEDDKKTIDISYYYGAIDNIITIERDIYTDKKSGYAFIRYIFNDYDENGIIYQQRIYINELTDNKNSQITMQATINIEVEYFESKVQDDDYLMFTLPFDSIAIRKL